MSILDIFKRKPVEVEPEEVTQPIVVERVIERIVEVSGSDANLLAALLVEMRIANELHVFKLNPDDVQRKLVSDMRGES